MSGNYNQGEMRYEWAVAMEVAKRWCVALKPWCERMVVAGSVRRRRKLVGDLDIVVVSRRVPDPAAQDLFSAPGLECGVGLHLDAWLRAGVAARRKGQRGADLACGPRNKLLVDTASGMPVDVYVTPPEEYWNLVVCRTGPVGLNVRLCQMAAQRGLKWHPYGAGFTRLADGEWLPVSSEEEVFRAVGLPYVVPEERDALA